MLKIEPQVVPYRDWQIEVVEEEGEFFFRCYPPEISDFCNDGSTHTNFRTAFIAALQFIDREVAIKTLIDLVNEWVYQGTISEEEYWNLTDFD